jgi:hypothetical protein
MKFLIDECLSPDLAGLAIAAGHVESAFLGTAACLVSPITS